MRAVKSTRDATVPSVPTDRARESKSPSAPIRVVHVVESFGSGVKNSVLSYVANTPDIEHHLLWSTHSDTTVDEQDLEPFASHQFLPAGHAARVRAVRTAVKRLGTPVVHAHSSWAGVYVRLALRHSHELSIVYTPHGYSFQRQDLPGVARALFRVAEWVLSFNTTKVAACGQHEARLSEWPFKHPSISVVPNVSHDSGPMADPVQTEPDDMRPSDGPEAGDSGPPEGSVVVGVGRLCNAKDPTFFAESIRELRASDPSVRAVWIGEGDDHYARDLLDAGVEITGWLSADETWQVLSGSTVYLHTARWEGFPLSVLEAASAGLPIIGRDIGALRDEGLPLLFSEPREIVDIWTRLGDDDERRAAREFARRFAESHSDARQADALHVMYRGLPSVAAQASVGGSRR